MPYIALIDDTVQVEFRTDPVGPWPALTGTVRPATALELDLHQGEAARANGEADRHRLRAAFVARHLRRWELTDADGRPVPPSADAFARLPKGVQVQVFDAAAGFAGVAVVPKADDS